MFNALLSLRNASEPPGANDRAGLIEDMNTRYGDQQTLGKVVALSAGTLKALYGEKGSEGIRAFFKRNDVVDLCNVPLDSPKFGEASKQLAEMEYAHWSALKEADPNALGPRAGAAFDPFSRDLIQKGLALLVRVQSPAGNQSVTSMVANLNAFSGQPPTVADGQAQSPTPPITFLVVPQWGSRPSGPA
ncbi:hypothetical protein ACIODW_16540 [Streptomyces sp. NPDC087897]|uniref:hypothetical protein n=1 Tax=Streptomyces sp. NPDC087897 TaxID=3365817 RepID=UPI0037FE9BAD